MRARLSFISDASKSLFVSSAAQLPSNRDSITDNVALSCALQRYMYSGQRLAAKQQSEIPQKPFAPMTLPILKFISIRRKERGEIILILCSWQRIHKIPACVMICYNHQNLNIVASHT